MPIATKTFFRVDTADQVRTDADGGGSLLNQLTGMGTSRDRNSYFRVRPVVPLDQFTCESLYGNWIPRKVVNIVSSRATRNGWTLTLEGKGGQDKVAEVDNWVKRSGLVAQIKECSILSRLYGGAVGVLLADDGQDASKPLDLKRIKTFTGIKPLDRWQLYPTIDGNALYDYREAEHFNILTYQALAMKEGDTAGGTKFFKIHRSRLLLFWGDYVPYAIRQDNEGWGYSALQPVYDPWRRFEAGLNGLGMSLQDFNLFIRKMSGVANKVARGKKDEVLARLRLDSLVQSVMGGLLLDEGEEASFISRTYAGVSDVIAEFASNICGATQIPHTLLFGESPSGLGATGRSEERDFASVCEEYQDDHLAEPLRYLMTVVMAAKDGPTKGKPLQDWDIKFNPTFVLNESEQADLVTKYAQADQVYVGLGVRTAEETALDRFSGDEFGVNWTLGYDRVVKSPEEKAAEQAEADQAAYEAQMEAAPAEAPAEAPAPEAAPAEEPIPPNIEQDLLDSAREDGSDPIKRLVRMNGLTVGITHDPGDTRGGHLHTQSYGHVRNTYGMGKDGKSIDCYLCANPTEGTVYRIRQLTRDGIYDEDKLMVGYPSIAAARDAYQEQMPRHAYGGIEILTPEDLELMLSRETTY